MRRFAPWLIVAILTSTLTAVTTRQALDRYRTFQTGWSWDLAYYNQWFWALTRGDRVLSVQPIAPYADEGPSVWKMNYLAPIRFALIPIYHLFPGPETLLIVQNVVFWWIIPAAFTLARAESKSDGVALAATLLVPMTPLLWPLAWNDFRELQLALPFVLWAIQGYRGRQLWLSALGILGMLACRQEFALVVASFAILPPRQPEDPRRTQLWAQTVLLLGLAWMLFGFFGYLKWMVGAHTPRHFVDQFTGPKAPIGATLLTAMDFLWIGLGSWAILAILAPRVALLAVPWVWSLANGRWALRLLASEEWHHVRYTAPFVALVIAAGIIGFTRMAGWLLDRRGGRWLLPLAWAFAAAGLLAPMQEVLSRFAYAEKRISPEEAAAVWSWIGRVGPDDSVLAGYEVTAPLSSRRRLYSYVLDKNKPKGYPGLTADFRWLFLRKGAIATQPFVDQGFELVHDGPYFQVFRRLDRRAGSIPRKNSGPARTFGALGESKALNGGATRRAAQTLSPVSHPRGRIVLLGDGRPSRQARPGPAAEAPPSLMSPHVSIPPESGGGEG